MPLPSTMTPIATNTLVSGSSTVTFSNIPQNYTDLVVVASGTAGPNGISSPRCTFNGDSGSNYSRTFLGGDGSAAYTGRNENSSLLIFGNTVGWSASENCNFIVNIMNYSNSSTFKTVLIRVNGVSAIYPGTDSAVGLYRSTSPITSVALSMGTVDSFNSGTTLTLYGIKAA